MKPLEWLHTDHSNYESWDFRHHITNGIRVTVTEINTSRLKMKANNTLKNHRESMFLMLFELLWGAISPLSHGFNRPTVFLLFVSGLFRLL